MKSLKKDKESHRMTVMEAYEAQQERERIRLQQAAVRKNLVEASTKEETILSPQ